MACEALFNTHCFLFFFLPAVLLGYWAVPNRTWKLAWLAASSFVFYSFWDVRFVALLVASSIVDYVVAGRIAAAQGPDRKRWLWVSIVFNLGVLAFFKYTLFALDNARTILAWLGSDAVVPHYNIVLPVGISFYTFQTLSYTIDVYRGDVGRSRSFIEYLAYVTLFPQLVAGPIVRYRFVAQQLAELPRRPNAGRFVLGLTLFTTGLAKKVIVADTVAFFIQPFWSDPVGLTTIEAWTAALGYTVQLYFDFSGYSDMAIGLGALLGLRFPINFNAPYQAVNISDFWRRWHISLSTFLRDYLYIPLGGNRLGPRRAQVNMLIVMLLGGLWHGAAWTFVVWGLYHGLLLAGYRAVQPQWDAMPRWLQRGATLFLVVIGWVVFRAPDLGTAGHVLASMLLPRGPLLAFTPVLAAIVAVLVATWFLRPTAQWHLKRPSPLRALVMAALFTVSVVLMFNESPFLYYQF